jgi:hypothetical protein
MEEAFFEVYESESRVPIIQYLVETMRILERNLGTIAKMVPLSLSVFKGSYSYFD